MPPSSAPRAVPRRPTRVRSLGADLAVDYARDGWTEEVRAFVAARGAGGATAVLDAVGGELGRVAAGLLAPGGRHLVYGCAAGGPVQFADGELAARGITSHVLVGPALLKLTGTPQGMRELESEALAAAADGRLVPAVETFALDQAAAAHRALESRATMGKVVLLT